MFVLTKLWVKHCQKLWDDKNKFNKKPMSKKCGSKRNLGPNNMWVKTKFGSKNDLGPRQYG